MSEHLAEKYDSSTKRLITALLISVLFHVVFLLATTVDAPAAIDKAIEVELIPVQKEAQQEKKQIVSKSLAPEIKPPEEVNKLSDKDAFVKKEQIKRGQTVESPPSQPQQQQQPKKLDLVNKELLGKIAERNLPEVESKDALKLDLEKKNKQKENQTIAVLNNYRPFSRSNNFPDARAGESDFLPTVPDGDVTLLNAKAYKYSIFVRRVALNVFAALRRRSWQELPASEIRGTGDFVEVRAVLSREGKLISAEIVDSSGSRIYDLVLKKSVQDGAWDKNPPAGVEQADGNIHFVFKAKSWSRGASQERLEQRWTLLATGLH